MKVEEIEKYLSEQNVNFNEKINEGIEKFRVEAIAKKNEKMANYFWCLRQVFRIQKDFVCAVNSLCAKRFEDAWLMLDKVDIAISSLEGNFDIEQQNDKYHIVFIKRIISEYQKLFPYQVFFSRESIIKKEECSICGKEISLRNTCGHKVGKLYMGELCLRRIVDMEFKGMCIVNDPFDKYTYLQIPGKEYNYGMLEALMSELHNPYDDFCIETVKVKRDEYKSTQRNDKCPCGSDKKYKVCCMGTKKELMNHYIVHIKKKEASENRFVGTFGTWK